MNIKSDFFYYFDAIVIFLDPKNIPNDVLFVVLSLISTEIWPI